MSSFNLTLSSMKQMIPYVFQVSSTVAPSLSAHWAQELFLRPKRLPLSTKEEALLKEAKIETLQSGRKVYFWGQPNSPIVALLHGWESRASAFFKWVPILIENGFQVMGWDAPAHGHSPGEKTTAPDMAKAFAEDLRELGHTLHGVVGHSMGGVVVGLLPLYMTLPKKVAIISSPSRIQGVFDRFHDQIRLQNKAREIFIRRIERKTGVNLENGSLYKNDLSLTSDALIIHDIGDREIPFSDFQDLQNSWSRAQFVATEGLGHRRILRDESVGHQIAQFLRASSHSS